MSLVASLHEGAPGTSAAVGSSKDPMPQEEEEDSPPQSKKKKRNQEDRFYQLFKQDMQETKLREEARDKIIYEQFDTLLLLQNKKDWLQDTFLIYWFSPERVILR